MEQLKLDIANKNPEKKLINTFANQQINNRRFAMLCKKGSM